MAPTPHHDHDIDTLRRDLEKVFRDWIGKGHLPLEAISSATAVTAKYLRDVDRVLGVASAEPVTPPPRSPAGPRNDKRRGPPSDRPERIIAILKDLGRSVRVADVLKRAQEKYPNEEWETRQISTILVRAENREGSGVKKRKSGKNYLYRYREPGDDQLELVDPAGEETH